MFFYDILYFWCYVILGDKMKKDIRKIYKTTDGYFNSRLDIKKTRLVAVLYQRDDSAVIVTKIYSKKNKKGNAYINKLTLKPKKHKSLKEDSIVGNSLIYGKLIDGKKHKIDPNDFIYTDDKLTYTEFLLIKQKINSQTSKHLKTKKATIKKWKRHFK